MENKNNNYTWDIEKMIENDIQFEKLSKEIISLTKNIKDMENHILDNANTLTDYLKTSEELYRKLELVYTYANMICDTDSLNNDYQKLKLKAEKLYDEVNEKLSFVKTEILNNNLEYINTLLQTSNYLSDYKLSFEKLFRYQKYTLSDKLWIYLQNYAAKHKAAGNGFGYGIAPLDGVARTLSARYYKDGSEVLIEQPGKNPRKLTPRECARLQGFPDSFVIPVSDTQAYRQFGNSVVVPLMECVAKLVVQKIAILDFEMEEQYREAM